MAKFSQWLTLFVLALLLTSPAFPGRNGAQMSADDERNNVTALHLEVVAPHEDAEVKDFTTAFTKALYRNWLAAMPENALLGAAGVVVIRFQVNKDRSPSTESPVVEQDPGKKLDSLTKAALRAVRDSAKSNHLPAGFTYSSVELRATFSYNQPAESPKR